MSISHNLIEQIRIRARIEDIAAKYIPSLKKKGNNFTGLCPFHREKTPSFVVSPDKQIYHCFGCHSGGNVFSFISKIENLSFPESVRYIGKLLGIEVNESEEQSDDEYYRINDFAMRLYQKYLQEEGGSAGRDYLRNRGLTDESISTFRLGYAPDSWDFLKSALIRKKADLAKAAEISVLASKKKESGVHYFDFFRNRIIFPITDRFGKVAAFGGRVLGDEEPKYLNSPETRIYRKREFLYGYEHAKKEIGLLKRAIIVEGYLDVIGCHQVGIRNVVAPLGTALTEDQVRFLSKSAEEIILLFDADSAGFRASLRSIGVAGNFNINVRVALLPDDDPFDFAVKKGMRELLAVIDGALDKDEFRISAAVKDISSRGRKSAVAAIFETAKEMQFETDREDFLKKAAPYIETDYITLINDYKRYDSGFKYRNESLKKTVKENIGYVDQCYKDLIVLMINNPSFIEKASFDFSENIPDSVYGRIFSRIIDIYSENEEIESAGFFSFINGDEKSLIDESILIADSVEDPERSYNEIYLSLKIYMINRKIDTYANLALKDPSTDILLELESWKREKEKIGVYLDKIRGTKHDSGSFDVF